VNFTIVFDQEEDGRWIAEIEQIPGALAYGETREEATARVEALALRVIADRMETGQASTDRIIFAIA
jgi:predicted RNase H-like HicB family nuclease